MHEMAWSRGLIGIALLLLLAATVALIARPSREPGASVASSATDREGTMALGPSQPTNRQGLQIHVGHRFPSTVAKAPTADTVQSKLWFHDGTWWGVLLGASSQTFAIHRLEPDLATWTETPVVVDERREARADVLWDGDHLYAVSGGTSAGDPVPVLLMRYSFDPAAGSYVLDAGYPIRLADTGVGSLTIAKDTAGVVWVSYIIRGQVWLNRAAGDGAWGEPFPLPGAGESIADVSAVVAYGGRIGVVWTSQADGTVTLASHADDEPADAWTSTTLLEGTQAVDDHLSARSLDGPDGTTLFVAVKTSRDILPDGEGADAQVLLLELTPTGERHQHVYGRLADHHTRPLLLIDEEHRELYLFAVSPFGAGSVYYKRTSADAIEFAEGKGAPFLDVPARPAVTDPTSTKQNLDGSVPLVVVAADESTNVYLHGVLPLGEETFP